MSQLKYKRLAFTGRWAWRRGAVSRGDAGAWPALV